MKIISKKFVLKNNVKHHKTPFLMNNNSNETKIQKIILKHNNTLLLMKDNSENNITKIVLENNIKHHFLMSNNSNEYLTRNILLENIMTHHKTPLNLVHLKNKKDTMKRLNSVQILISYIFRNF